MNRIPVKGSRLRLAPELYENLRQQVLRRDGWRCQSCGALTNLEVHHRELMREFRRKMSRKLWWKLWGVWWGLGGVSIVSLRKQP